MSLRYRAVKKVTREVKSRTLAQLEEYLKNYKYMVIAELVKVGSAELQTMRKLLRSVAVLKVARNRLVQKAIERVHGTKFDLTGQNLFIFTNKNPFELYLFLQRNKIATEAQAGMIAPKDIVVPEGNTGLAPGPVLSKFSKLKVPTKIVEGSIWIAKDTVVAKQGEVISKDVVELLNLLGIKPIETTLNLRLAYDGKEIIKDIRLDLDEMMKEIKNAQGNALKLALNASLPVVEVMPMLIQRAYQEYLKIAENLVVPEKDILPKNISKAKIIAETLYQRLKDKL
ncbi:MAG TPA: 50S ribosomal protein L10 [Geobacterales bacterium]|nr:50S ribosomal protein L10 [Geobacterales bacterium]